MKKRSKEIKRLISEKDREIDDLNFQISELESEISKLEDELEEAEEAEYVEENGGITKVMEENSKQFGIDVSNLSKVEKSLLDFRYHNFY